MAMTHIEEEPFFHHQFCTYRLDQAMTLSSSPLYLNNSDHSIALLESNLGIAEENNRDYMVTIEVVRIN
jgi:hypothetical protein